MRVKILGLETYVKTFLHRVFMLTIGLFDIKIPLYAGMAEWQTRTVQVRVLAITCGFKSHFLHVWAAF